MTQIWILFPLFLLTLPHACSESIQILIGPGNRVKINPPISCGETINVQNNKLNAIDITYNTSDKYCQYTFHEGKCYNASQYKIAAKYNTSPESHCNIENIDDWNEISKNLYQTFMTTLKRTGDKVVFEALPCIEQGNQEYAITTETTNNEWCYNYTTGKCYDSKKVKFAGNCTLNNLEKRDKFPCSRFTVSKNDNQNIFEISPCFVDDTTVEIHRHCANSRAEIQFNVGDHATCTVSYDTSKDCSHIQASSSHAGNYCKHQSGLPACTKSYGLWHHFLQTDNCSDIASQLQTCAKNSQAFTCSCFNKLPGWCEDSTNTNMTSTVGKHYWRMCQDGNNTEIRVRFCPTSTTTMTSVPTTDAASFTEPTASNPVQTSNHLQLFTTTNQPLETTRLVDTTLVNTTMVIDGTTPKPDLVMEANNFNPQDADDVNNIENLIKRIALSGLPPNESIHGHLYVKRVQIKEGQKQFTTMQELGSALIQFTLQTDGSSQIVASAFVFNTNYSQVVKGSSPNRDSLIKTEYIVPQNSTFVVIIGLKVNKPNNKTTDDDELQGNASYTLSSPIQETTCRKINDDKKKINKMAPLCLFFDRMKKEYSDHGCSTSQDAGTGKVTCKCNHLTLFTVLLAVKTTTIPKHLKITTYVTESVSIVFLVITIVTLYRNRRRSDRVPVQTNLAVALLLLHVINLSHDLFTMHDQSCMVGTAVNHIFLLCSGMWFLIEGIRLFMATSNPIKFQAQDSKDRLKYFMTFGWLLPVVIVGISAPVGFHFGVYMKPRPYYEACHQYQNNTSPIPKYDRCWLAPNTPVFYTSVITPLALVLLINLLIISKTSFVSLTSRRMRNRGDDPDQEGAKRAVKTFIFLFLLLGGTWSLAFFTGIGNEISNEVFMYIHSLVNGMQGFVVFLIYCVMDDVIRSTILPCSRA